MKQFTQYSLFSMALLAGAAAFTACSSDDNLAEETALVNPSYNGETVKTEFAINIPHANTNKRMTEGNAQGGDNPTFLGMEGINLIPLATTTAGTVTGSETPTTIIRLANIAGSGDLETGETNPGGTTEGRKIYSDVEIPTGTNTFLFYGQALYNTSPGYYSTEADKWFAQGALETSLDDGGISTVNSITFNLKQIMSSATVDFTTAKAALLTQLNAVMNVDNGSGNKWSDQQDGTETPTPSPPPSDDQKALARLYKNMTTTMKAGSANSIKIALEQLYNAVNDIAKKTGTPESEQTAIAKAIQAAIATSDNDKSLFSASGDDTNGYTLAYKTPDGNTAKFPGVFNLPEGIAQLKWEDGTGFSYVQDNTGSGDGITVGGTDKVSLNSLTYPASLAYYISTAAQTNDDPAATFPTAGNWGSDSWTGWESSVRPSTRLVALKDNIQYGVAQLATTVKFANNNVEDQKGNSVVVGATSFTLTGILVGGQPAALDYELMPAQSTEFEQTVYDNITTPLAVTTSDMATPNYTLLLDNKGAGGNDAEADKVNFALEMTNNGDAFYGVDGGLIAKGMKFYLVGTLNKAASGGNASSPAPSGVDHIFMQDYKTTATVTISSLENAYVTIPDLRATNLQLGLSVDLEWQEGYTFNVSID